ncbi:CHAT domain-containing protein [Paraburkholderia azotifigens]|uniref:CHAT domain-containing protein n=1 Tax=Paraburkholderia azotifigens TaxID=2057004 RepID=UPI0038B90925
MMRKITLELLRHGPPHNQLLSPLTEYIALCENHSAVTLHVPFEHNQMLYRLRALSYQLGPEAREFQMGDTARVLGQLLGEIPGLTADLNRQKTSTSDGSTAEQVTHLRLIMSASELALLPFELATAPNGFPGAGQALSLQTEQPVCITRETRRVPQEYMRWPRRPHILFAFASPPDMEAVPAEAHLLALREALTPWLALSDDYDEEKRLAIVGKRLSVLPNASAESLEAACAKNDYTHVHILAHGIQTNTPYDSRFGLAFHSDRHPDGMEAISGDRLATILRTPRHNQPGRFTRPAVVTLASCNAGNVGSVTGVGASIAHALHEAGVPLVIASQYPLSFGGSVVFVKDMYEGLLWGEDPRKLVVGMRRRLHSYFKDKHDWASIVTYASLPPNFDAQLADARIQQSMDCISIALSIADRAMSAFLTSDSLLPPTASSADKHAHRDALARAQQQVTDAKARLQLAIDEYPEQEARILELLASTEKREAQMIYHSTQQGKFDPGSKEGLQLINKLETSRNHYWSSYLKQRKSPSQLVQFLSLTLLLQHLGRLPRPLDQPDQDMTSIWLSAHLQSLNDADHGEQCTRAWAYGNLTELYLIAKHIDGLPPAFYGDQITNKALEAARKLVSLTGSTSFEVFSMRRQVVRYLNWFVPMAAGAYDIEALARELLTVLPACDEPDWDY